MTKESTHMDFLQGECAVTESALMKCGVEVPF